MKTLRRYALPVALLVGFAGGVAFAAGTNLGTIAHYLATVQNKTAAYTLVPTLAGDCGTEIVVTVSSTAAVTLPNTGVIGCQVTIVQGGSAKVTAAVTAGGSLVNPHLFTGTYAEGSTMTVKVTVNSGGSAAQWILGGDGS